MRPTAYILSGTFCILQLTVLKPPLGWSLMAKVPLLVPLGNVTLRFTDASAELVIGSVFAWMQAMTRFLAACQTTRTLNVTSAASIYLRLFSASRKSVKVTTDPLFLNRVSYLVQSAERNLRSDPGWKVGILLFCVFASCLSFLSVVLQVLAHFRHCMRHIDQVALLILRQELKDLPTHNDAPAMFELVATILEKWRPWEMDPSTIRYMPLLLTIFNHPKIIAKAGTRLRVATASLDLRMGTFVATLLDSSNSANRLHVGPIALLARADATVFCVWSAKLVCAYLSAASQCTQILSY